MSAADSGHSKEVAVSVLVPVHDAGAYLEPCLDSLLRQTFADLEVICVDDGSTDGSAGILTRYAQADRRFSVVSQPCRGVSAARNAALARARGTYVLFVDADDTVDPTLLEKAVGTARALHTDMTVFGFGEYFAGSDALVPREMCGQADLYGRAFRLADLRGVATGLLTPNVWRILFARSFLQGCGLRFHEELRTSEDLAFIYEALAHDPLIALVDERLYRYRRDGGNSLTHADRGTDGYRALELIGAHDDGRYLSDPPLLRHYVNLVLDVARYDLYSANGADEYRRLYKAFQEHLLPLVARNEQLVDPEYRPFYDKVSALDAPTYLFEIYMEHRTAFENARAWGTSLQAQLDAALQRERNLRTSWAFRVGRTLTWLPSKAKTLINRQKKGGRRVR